MGIAAPPRGLIRRDDDETPIRPRSFGAADVGLVFGSAISGMCLGWLLYYRLTPLQGATGYWICAYGLFLAIYWLATRERLGRLAATDRVMGVVLASTGVAMAVTLLFVLGYTVLRGLPALRPHFFTKTQRFVGPLSKSTEGGAAHAIVGSAEQVGLALVVSVPLGVMTAVFLNEVGGWLARPVRMIVDAMSATPSIVAGLFIYAMFILALGNHQSGFAAALALSVLMLPTVARTTEVVFRLVPGGLREASLALGGTEWRMVRKVVVPTARSGLITAIILGIARTVGETSPLLFTAGGANTMNANPFRGPQQALPLFVYRLINFPQKAQINRAWTGALVLIMLILTLFVIARKIGGRRPGERRRRRLVRRVRIDPA
jgi:phosphate transport system permease protein